jgi:hypothetical protein
MGLLMRDVKLINRDFVLARIGGEMGPHKNAEAKKTWQQRVSRFVSDVRSQLALAAVTVLDGTTGRAAYREGRFRQSGEVHRWMYDRISLAALLEEVGFADARVCGAGESRITGFDSYQLDRDETQVARKPDSLYLEAVKFTAADQSAADQSAADQSAAQRSAIRAA